MFAFWDCVYTLCVFCVSVLGVCVDVCVWMCVWCLCF